MEIKLTRFVSLISALIAFVALLHILDEALHPIIKLGEIVDNRIEVPLKESFRINNNNDYTTLVKTEENQDFPFIVEITEKQFFEFKTGDTLVVFKSPIYHKVRRVKSYNELTSKEKSRFMHLDYSRKIHTFIFPLLIIVFSILSWKIQEFHLKFAVFLFNIIFSVVVQWMLY